MIPAWLVGWAAKKGWDLTKPAAQKVARGLVYAVVLACIGITAFVVYRGIRDGIAKANQTAYERGFAVGQTVAEAKCREDYLAAVNRALLTNAEATEKARASINSLAKNLNADLATVEGIAREPRPAAADGCRPAADGRVVRAGEKLATDRAAAEARLRDLRSAADRGAAVAGGR